MSGYNQGSIVETADLMVVPYMNTTQRLVQGRSKAARHNQGQTSADNNGIRSNMQSILQCRDRHVMAYP